ncbi:MAG: glycosyltransferase family 4 protein [Propionicimonas sp.]
MGEQRRIVIMPGNDVLTDVRAMKNLATAASLGLDAIGLGVTRSGQLRTRRIGDIRIRIVAVPPAAGDQGLVAWLRRARRAFRFGYATEQQEQEARARLSYFIREVHADEARRCRDSDRAPIVAGPSRSSAVAAGRLRIRVARSAVEFHAYLGRRRRAAAEAQARRFPDRMAAVAAARKVVRWRDELPAAIDDDIVLGRELDRICPDIIHVHDVFMMGVAARAAGRAALKGRKIHLVYDAREYLPGLACVPERLIAAYCDLESEFLPDFDRVITVSEPLADLLVKDHGLLRRPDLVLNAPVVDQEADDVPQLREVIGLAEGIPLLVYGGGVNSARGVQTVIEALVHLPGVHFALVVRAPNSVTMHLEALAEELGVADRFHQAGFVPPGQVTQYFASADIGVSPLLHFVNHDVALTNKFCEYLLAGLPVVTSDTPAQADLVTELGLGEVYPAGEVAAFVNAVNSVLARLPELRARVREPQLQHRFSWAAQEEVLRGVYDDLVGVVDAEPPDGSPSGAAAEAVSQR